MTEEEAKTKWCPFSRTAAWDDGRGGNAATFNRPWVGTQHSTNRECVCLASGCACWMPDRATVTLDGGMTFEEQDLDTGHCGLMR